MNARPGPTGIGLGSKNVGKPITEIDRKANEKDLIREVETQKKATLDKLNNIQSKKFTGAY